MYLRSLFPKVLCDKSKKADACMEPGDAQAIELIVVAAAGCMPRMIFDCSVYLYGV